jgi:hypothetical protein
MDIQQPVKRLIESPLYEKNKNKITENTKLLDTVLEGVTFSIASKPDTFPSLDEYGTRSAKTDEALGLPELTIFFKEEDQHIYLMNIQPTPNPSRI